MKHLLVHIALVVGKAGAGGGAVSGAETEAEGDATDGEGAAGEGGDALPADLPAELTALVTAATTDQSELPDLFGDPQIFGESGSRGCQFQDTVGLCNYNPHACLKGGGFRSSCCVQCLPVLLTNSHDWLLRIWLYCEPLCLCVPCCPVCRPAGAFTELVSVLRADGRTEEAGSLLSRASTLANARGTALNGGWWGPSATGKQCGWR